MRLDNSKRRAALATAVAGAILGFGWSSGAEKSEGPTKSEGPQAESSVMTLTGTVEEVDESQRGEHAVRVNSPEHGKLLVQDAGKGAELTKHIGEKITLTAHRKHNGQGEPVLSVEHYRVHDS